jgi:hypothetical protein
MAAAMDARHADCRPLVELRDRLHELDMADEMKRLGMKDGATLGRLECAFVVKILNTSFCSTCDTLAAQRAHKRAIALTLTTLDAPPDPPEACDVAYLNMTLAMVFGEAGLYPEALSVIERAFVDIMPYVLSNVDGTPLKEPQFKYVVDRDRRMAEIHKLFCETTTAYGIMLVKSGRIAKAIALVQPLVSLVAELKNLTTDERAFQTRMIEAVLRKAEQDRASGLERPRGCDYVGCTIERKKKDSKQESPVPVPGAAAAAAAASCSFSMADGQPQPVLKQCVGCHMVAYCSRACQQGDRQRHKQVCKPVVNIVRVARVAGAPPPSATPSSHLQQPIVVVASHDSKEAPPGA